MSVIVAIIGFAIISLASRQIGQYFSSIRLPYITGYLFAGVLVGPFALEFIQQDAIEDLRFIEEISLAVIAFVAGSELYITELRSRIRTIAINDFSQLFAIFILSSIAVFLLTDFIPFTKSMSTDSRIAVAILAGTILVSRSPAAMVAVIKELRAKGDFTKTILGITVSMDILVITLFAITTPLARVFLTGESFDPAFVIYLAIDLTANMVLGVAAGGFLRLILISHLSRLMKAALILITGYAIFFLAHEIQHWTHEHLSFEIVIEPLLPAMIASFILTNLSRYRTELIEILEDIAPVIYVAFFTVTGIALNLDILQQTILIALALFAIRILGVFMGAFGGGLLAGEPIATNRILWMAFISQAGVSLGLTREVAVEFDQLGDNFATMLISVIVLNEMVGPIFLRYAIKQSGEAHLPEAGGTDIQRDAVIMGIEPQSIALARQLAAHHWHVIMADTTEIKTELQAVESDLINMCRIVSIDDDILGTLINGKTDAVVAMLDKDSENFKVCRFTSDHFEGPRLVVRLKDPTWTNHFAELGAMVVNPTDAMVNLLDQFVRVPQSAALLMHRDPTQEIAQVTITDPDIDNLPLRDLRLPSEVLILSIMREGQSIVPHGYTNLKLYDEVTLVGDPEKLKDATLQLGY